MKCFSLVVSYLLIFIFTPSLSYTAEMKENLLETVSFQSDPGKKETIRFQLSGEVIPEISTIGGKKPRVILDFFNTLANEALKSSTDISGELVKSIRMGRHLEPKLKVRVVVDILPNVKYHFTHNQNVQDNSFDLVIHSGEEGEAEVTSKELVLPKKKTASVKVAAVRKEKMVEPDSPAKAHEKLESINEKVVPDLGVFTAQPIEEEKIDIDIPETSKSTSTISINGSKKQRDAQLLDVTFENTSNKGEMVLFKLNGFYPPIVFGVEKGEPRVVCDFLDTSLAKKVEEHIKCYGRFIKSIRVDSTSDSGKVRVVLNLMENKNYDLQQVFFKEDNLFVLIVDTLEDI